MKKLAICLIIVLVTATVFAEVMEGIGTDLLRATRLITKHGGGAGLTTNDAIDGSFYSGYISGYIGAASLTRVVKKWEPGREGPLHCLPEEGISSEHVAFIVENYLNKNTDKLHLPAQVLLFAALDEVYPCK